MYKTTLRIVHQDKKLNLKDLLQKEESVSLHIGNNLAAGIYKVKNGLSPEIIKELFNFQENENYNLGSGIQLACRNLYTAHFGTDNMI